MKMFTLIIGLIVLTGCTQKTQVPILDNAKSSSIQEVILEDEDENWTRYQNVDLGFSIKHPSDWIASESGKSTQSSSVSFGTEESRQGGYIWGATFYPHTYKTLEEHISRIGEQFTDSPGEERYETRKQFVLNGADALLLTVTNNDNPNWVSRSIFLEQSQGIYVISNGADLRSDKKYNFDTFYQSFVLLNK